MQHVVLNRNFFRGQDVVHSSAGDAARKLRLDHGGHHSIDFRGLKQEIPWLTDGILSYRSHVQQVLIAAQELRGRRLETSECNVRDVSANHGSTELADLQLIDPIDGPGKSVVQAGQNARRGHSSPCGDHGLLIRSHQIDAGKKPCPQKPESQAAVSTNSRSFRRSYFRTSDEHRAHLTPASPLDRILSSSESEFRMMVVLSSSTFL